MREREEGEALPRRVILPERRIHLFLGILLLSKCYVTGYTSIR